MKIADLSYFEELSDANSIQGGITVSMQRAGTNEPGKSSTTSTISFQIFNNGKLLANASLGKSLVSINLLGNHVTFTTPKVTTAIKFTLIKLLKLGK